MVVACSFVKDGGGVCMNGDISLFDSRTGSGGVFLKRPEKKSVIKEENPVLFSTAASCSVVGVFLKVSVIFPTTYSVADRVCSAIQAISMILQDELVDSSGV